VGEQNGWRKWGKACAYAASYVHTESGNTSLLNKNKIARTKIGLCIGLPA